MSNPPHEPQGNGSVPEPGSTPQNAVPQNNGAQPAPEQNSAPYGQNPGQSAQYGQQPYGVPAQGQQPYGAPVQGQPEKKKETGLIIGIVVAILTAVTLVLSTGGADARYDSREDFTQKIDQVVEGSSLEHCSIGSDTIVSSSLDSSLSNQPFGADDVYLCSEADFSSLLGLMGMDSSHEPDLLLGVYAGDDLATDDQDPENVVDDLDLSDGDWAVYGKNWVIVGTDGISEDVKKKVLDKVGGKELTQE